MLEVAGLLCTALLVAVAELSATLLRGARSPFEAAGHAIIDVTPGPLVDFGVALLQEQDKLVVRLSVGAILAVTGLAVGATTSFRLTYGCVGLFLITLLLLTAAVTRAEARALPMAASCLAGGWVSLLAFWWLYRASDVWPLLAVSALTLLLALTALALKLQRRAAYAAARAGLLSLESGDRRGQMSPLVSRVGEHYVIDVKLSKPLVDLKSWQLRVGGFVKNELCLTYEDLLAQSLVEHVVTLRCVHDPPGGPRAGTATWRGVRVSDLLMSAGLVSRAVSVVARSVDGYEARVPLDVLETSGALVALGMNGNKLTPAHGFPARLVTPGVYGFDANTKWLTELEVVADDVKDWGEKRGWPAAPRFVQPCARIDIPTHLTEVSAGEITVSGVAWSHGDGVEAVEVRVDGGKWQPAELGSEVNTYTWRQWNFVWQAVQGRHSLEARVKGRERRQVETPSGAFPDGPTGLHSVHMFVVASPSIEGSAARKLEKLFLELRGRSRMALLWLRAWF